MTKYKAKILTSTWVCHGASPMVIAWQQWFETHVYWITLYEKYWKMVYPQWSFNFFCLSSFNGIGSSSRPLSDKPTWLKRDFWSLLQAAVVMAIKSLTTSCRLPQGWNCPGRTTVPWTQRTCRFYTFLRIKPPDGCNNSESCPNTLSRVTLRSWGLVTMVAGTGV